MFSVDLFLSLLFIISIVTSVLTEAFKKYFESNNSSYSSNKIALIISLLASGFTITGYFIFGKIPFSVSTLPQLIFFSILLCVASWLSAMLGYDKIVQLIKQIKDTKL